MYLAVISQLIKNINYKLVMGLLSFVLLKHDELWLHLTANSSISGSCDDEFLHVHQ